MSQHKWVKRRHCSYCQGEHLMDAKRMKEHCRLMERVLAAKLTLPSGLVVPKV